MKRFSKTERFKKKRSLVYWEIASSNPDEEFHVLSGREGCRYHDTSQSRASVIAHAWKHRASEEARGSWLVIWESCLVGENWT